MKVVVFDYLGSIDPDSVGAVMDVGTWQAQPGIADAIAHLNHHGWHVVQAVNQPGLGRGSLEIAELTAVQQRLQKILNAAGGRIEAFFFCPHAPEEHCDCRKPAPGLLLQIAARCGVAPQELWVVGLCQAHIQAGLAVGAKVALVMPDPSLHIDCTPCAQSPLPRYANWMALAHALAPD